MGEIVTSRDAETDAVTVATEWESARHACHQIVNFELDIPDRAPFYC